jgi:flavin reductase (DIM6/NTAB) family NADH-FMN oxidoreductase RutF
MKNLDDQLILRKCWGKFATGVSIITTIVPNNKIHGMTANSILSVSLNPPVVLVSIGMQRNTHGLIKRNRSFGITILNSNQKEIAEFFSKDNLSEDNGFNYKMMPGGQFVISESIAQFECNIIKEISVYDHTLFLSKIENFNFANGNPLIWLDSKYNDFN